MHGVRACTPRFVPSARRTNLYAIIILCGRWGCSRWPTWRPTWWPTWRWTWWPTRWPIRWPTWRLTWWPTWKWTSFQWVNLVEFWKLFVCYIKSVSECSNLVRELVTVDYKKRRFIELGRKMSKLLNIIYDIYILYENRQVGPFPSESFQMSPQIAWRIGCIVPLWLFICLLKLPVWEDA